MRSQTSWVWWTALAGVFFAQGVSAEELPVFYKGIRPLGMGGAFTAVADDENAMFYNPAGLNSIEGFGRLDLLNPYLEVSRNTIDFFKDLQDVSDAATDSEQLSLATDLLNRWLGKHLHARTGVFPNITIHNFGIGVLAQGTLDGEVHHILAQNTLEVRGGYDIALLVAAGAGFPLFGDSRIQIGATGKIVHRERIDQSYSANDLAQENGIDLDRDLRDGTGYGLDLGLIYTLPLPFDPALGVSLQNLGDLDLGDAGTVEQQVNMGIALKPPVGIGNLILAVDVVDVTRELGSDKDWGKRLHGGVEYRFPVILAVRAGINQGYVGAGATVDLWAVKIAYAYTVEEIGAFVGQEEDRRHVAQVSIGF